VRLRSLIGVVEWLMAGVESNGQLTSRSDACKLLDDQDLDIWAEDVPSLMCVYVCLHFRSKKSRLGRFSFQTKDLLHLKNNDVPYEHPKYTCDRLSVSLIIPTGDRKRLPLSSPSPSSLHPPKLFYKTCQPTLPQSQPRSLT